MTYRNRNFRHRQARRGVTLLLVLGLMTMFAMLVVTFMVVTTQAMRTSQSVAEVALRYEGKTRLDSLATSSASIPTPDIGLAIDTLLVGDKLQTVIGPHSILENLYGHPNYIFNTSGDETKNLEGNATASQIGTSDLFSVNITLDGNHKLSTAVDLFDYVGSVLTVGNKSAIIATADLSGTSLDLEVVPVDKTTTATDLNGTAYINTRAFGGTGPGYYRSNPYNAGDPLLVLKDDELDSDGNLNNPGAGSGFELTLRPNVLAPDSGDQKYKKYLENHLVLMNPDYTAPDYQNMFLAWKEITGSVDSYYTNKVIPSFHRPSLVEYWNNTTTLDEESLRKIVLRPLKQDHPDFTGSNPAANVGSLTGGEISFLINGPWDVDNDGDGIQDGIWLDLGATPQLINGKLYKALYSFYVLDMDGRLNVNTHGMDTTLPSGSGSGTIDPDTGGLTDTYGSGFGVAEIRLGEGLDIVSSDNIFLQLLEGNTTGNPDHIGRYGSDKEPGDANDTDGGLTSGLDALGRTMGIWHGAYATPDGGGYTGGYGGMLPDFSGEGAILFDALGNRTFDSTLTGPFFAQNPYMLNPYYKDQQVGDDSPYDVKDLEFLIRSVGDKKFIDKLSGTRLRHLIDSSDFDPTKPSDVAKFSKYRHFVTTQSTDIPAASNAGLGGYKGIFEYLVNEISSTQADALAKLLPPELLRGEKMSLDRIMHLEANLQGPSNRQKLLQEKARFAQEMFYLMIVLCNEELPASSDPDRPIAITRIAQWCVNLVDFLDADDVMTPLVFHETDPLNDAFDFAVTVPGFAAPSSGRRLVWGMEQPEVALTKTFATHNRRVADSKYGHKLDGSDIPIDRGIHTVHTTPSQGGCDGDFNRMIPAKGCVCCENGGRCPSPNHVGDDGQGYTHDTSFDQVMIPQGSLFLELYRAGNPNRTYYKNQTDTASLFDTAAGATDNSLDLAKTSPTGNSPVWRLAIGKSTKEKPGNDYVPDGKIHDLFDGVTGALEMYDFQPKDFTSGNSMGNGSCNVELERFIWFCDENAAIPEGTDCSYFNFGSPADTNKGDNAKLRPNEYLVIGPRMSTSFLSEPVDGDTVTDFGIPKSDLDTQINLADYTSTTNYPRTKVMVAAAPLDGANGVGTTWETACALGAGITGAGIGVSVSEPLPVAHFDADPDNNIEAGGYYSTAPNASGSYIGMGACNDVTEFNEKVDFEPSFGTITRYKSIFLQRLADPGQAYNATTNPYITVDWNMIDLHVFNSERDEEGASDTDDPDLEHDINNGLYFTMRQWGYTAATRQASDRPNIWDRSFDTTKIGNTEAGLLVTATQGQGTPKYLSDMILGKLANLDGVNPLTSGDDYEGAPDKAFLHFPWNNGPLSNTYELMLVPASSPSRFGFEFSTPTSAQAEDWWKSDSAGTEKAVPSLGKGTASKYMPICNPNCYIGPYFNFFNNDNAEPKLARLFDFVRVPSKFNGSVQGIDEDGKPVYRMREPGKINLNTANEAAWEALRMDDPNFPTYQEFRDTILGTNSSLPDLPTEFPFPIRSSSSGNLVPIGDLQYSDNPTVFRDVERTTPNPGDPDNPTSTPGLIFGPHDPVSGFADTTNKGTNQRTALENVLRRSDMITNRSNVFAVWITIGYFEVQQFQKNNLGNNDNTDLKNVYSGKLNHINTNNFDAIYPGGYVLGAEKGLDDGSVTRHRYFYLIDRSIPVGFRRGETGLNHRNVLLNDIEDGKLEE